MMTRDLLVRAKKLCPVFPEPTFKQLSYSSCQLKDSDAFERFPTAWQQKLIDEWVRDKVAADEIDRRINLWMGH